jgi:hypothetical protein
MKRPRRLVALGLLVAGAITPALAHHRQTPEILRYTSSGDTELPRLPSLGRTTIVFPIESGTGTQIVTVQPYKDPSLLKPIGPVGDNKNPSISFSGGVVAWDTTADPMNTGLPGRQIALAKRGTLIAGPADPSGTSENPSLDVTGARVAFESTADLGGTSNPSMKQVFLRGPGGVITQISTGIGSSTKPVLSPKKHLITFQSTSDPQTGLDTGVSQIWLGGIVATQPPSPITAGMADSTNPSFSDDGGVIVFESRANLANDQTDMGAPQIFIYHIKSKTYAQITREPGGCTSPAVGTFKRDWRVAYICNGVGYVYFLRADKRYVVDTRPRRDPPRVVPDPGTHFFVVATTGALLDGTGTTAGHQVYQVNAYKRPLTPFDAGYVARWFPFRGVPPAL